ncbi:UNVERIFIED_CONTAM: hypothetical protein GTU68_028385 [Idotea baltica]|nr:hypothetical protein [Idotea baltica]
MDSQYLVILMQQEILTEIFPCLKRERRHVMTT